MRYFLLLVVFLLASQVTLAQVGSPSRPLDSLAIQPLNTDTAAAIHRFYLTKRRARTRVLLGTAGLFALSSFIGNVFGSDKYGSYDGNAIRTFNLVALSIPVVSAELLYYGLYSRRHERFAREDFEAHKLPASIKRQLKPRYFQPDTKAR